MSFYSNDGCAGMDAGFPWMELSGKEGKMGVYVMKRVAAGAHFPTLRRLILGRDVTSSKLAPLGPTCFPLGKKINQHC